MLGQEKLDRSDFNRPGPPPKRPLLFYKLIVSSIVQANRLSIPQKFVKRYGDQLSAVTTFTLPNGGVWHVRLPKADNKLWFFYGWHEFVEYYSIHVGNTIFDECLDQHPLGIDHSENLGPTMDADDLQATFQSTRDVGVQFDSGEQTDPECEVGWLCLDAANEKANRIKAKRKRNEPAYPMEVCREVSQWVSTKFITLKVSDGKRWSVKCISSGEGNVKLSKGWAEFVKDNNLEEGYVCVFELINMRGYCAESFHIPCS